MTTSPLVKTAKSNIQLDTPIKKRNPTIEDFHFRDGLPSAEELPDSDGKPVDSELQELIPGLLKAILLDLWNDRSNWLFSIDMGFYYHPDKQAIAPDGLLSLGVEDIDDECLRFPFREATPTSYVLWDEKVIPLFALETVSKTPGKEQTKKFQIYQSIGILYYLVYAPLRKRKARFQLYKLTDGEYVLQSNGQQPYWMPEIGLAIGAEQWLYHRSQREWLFWYNQDSVRYPTPIERAKDAFQRAEAASKQAEAASKRADMAIAAQTAIERENIALRQRLRDLGIDPDA